MRRQRRFLGNTAHELRTPLTLLRAKIEDVPEPALRAELVRDIRRLTSLVSAMLDLARLQNQVIEKKAVNLSGLVREVLADFTPSALDIGVELSLEQERDEPVMVEGVEVALRSAIANLMSNALIHAAGATCIVAELKQGSVTIKDDGAGLPAGHGRNLIEPFQKGESSRQGAGLGLSIAQEIMVAHGGSLTVAFPQAGAPPLASAFRVLARHHSSHDMNGSLVLWTSSYRRRGRQRRGRQRKAINTRFMGFLIAIADRRGGGRPGSVEDCVRSG